MFKVFVKGSTGKEKILAIIFLAFCFVGMALGATLGCYILLTIYGGYDRIPRHLVKVILFITMPAAIPLFSVPFFLLVLRPFYTRESISHFFVSGRTSNLASGSLTYMNLIYKVGFRCIDLLYPKDDNDG